MLKNERKLLIYNKIKICKGINPSKNVCRKILFPHPLSVHLFCKVWTRPSGGKGQFLRSEKQTPCGHRFPWTALAFFFRPCPSRASQAARQGNRTVMPEAEIIQL